MDAQFDWIISNMASQLSELRNDLISHESFPAYPCHPHSCHNNTERNRKPYALPVQCIPYTGLGDMQVRDIIDKLIKEMITRSMKVGEHSFILRLFSFLE